MAHWSTPREHAILIQRALEEARRNLDLSPDPSLASPSDIEDDFNDSQLQDGEAEAIESLLRKSLSTSSSSSVENRQRDSYSSSPQRSDGHARISIDIELADVPVNIEAVDDPFADFGPNATPGRSPSRSSDERASRAAALSSLGPSSLSNLIDDASPTIENIDFMNHSSKASISNVALLPGRSSIQNITNPSVSIPCRAICQVQDLHSTNQADKLQHHALPTKKTGQSQAQLPAHERSPCLDSTDRSTFESPKTASHQIPVAPNKSSIEVASPSVLTGVAIARQKGRHLSAITEFERSLSTGIQTPDYKSMKMPVSYRDLGSSYTRYPHELDQSRRLSSAVDSVTDCGTSPAVSRQSLMSNSSEVSLTDRSSEKTVLISYSADLERGYTPFLDDRLGAPLSESNGYRFKMYHDEPEIDDDLHMPRYDDDIRYAPHWRDHFSKTNVCATLSLFLVLAGLFGIFIGLPVATATGWGWPDPYEKPPPGFHNHFDGPAWARVNNRAYPLLKNVRRGLIDPDTPDSARVKPNLHGQQMNLVFSDEFNNPGRSFYPGDDPFFYAPDFWYGSTGDVDWYSPEQVGTANGTLTLTLEYFRNHNLDYLSGMLHSWNHTCFKGGRFEVGVSLPGPAGVSGLWPGVWSMGNLGRPGYRATTDGVWPYTYDSCDSGITPNQSSYDGHSYLPGQRLPSCACRGSDHPSPGTGRGAPEIDIFEGAADSNLHMPTVTQSYQVAPFDVWYYPNYDYFEFPHLADNFSVINGYTGGPYQQAVSAVTTVNHNWFDGAGFQQFAYEYQPTSFTGEAADSYVAWYVGDDMTARFTGDALGPNGNVGRRLVSEEPMSLVMNLGISHNWGWIDWDHLEFPTTMRIDYVRWYQLEGHESVTCDPPGYETTAYIRDHPLAYTNPNLTKWDDAGYAWPQNSLTSDCSRPNHPAAPMSPAAAAADGSQYIGSGSDSGPPGL